MNEASKRMEAWMEDNEIRCQNQTAGWVGLEAKVLVIEKNKCYRVAHANQK